MMDNKQQFYDAILKMTFVEIQDIANDFMTSATDNDSDFDINNRDEWAWLFFGQAEGNFEGE